MARNELGIQHDSLEWLLGIGDPGQAIARFDSMSDADVAEALSWLTADSAYKQAVAAMGNNDGQRTI